MHALINKLTIFFNADKQRKQIVFRSLSFFSVKIIATLLGFIVSVVITRHVSLTEAGHYFFLLSLVTLLATISRVGLDNLIIKLMAIAHSDTLSRRVDAIFCFSRRRASIGALIAIAIYSLVSFGLAFISIPLNPVVIVGVVVLLPLTSLLSVYCQSFLGIKQSFASILISSFNRPIQLIGLGLCILVFGRLELSMVVASYVLAVVLSLVVAAYYWRRHYVQRCASDSSDSRWVKEEFSNRYKSLWAISVLAIVMGQGMQVLMGMISTPEQVALLAVANRVAILVAFFLLAVNSVVAPDFAVHYANKNLSQLQKVYRETTLLMIVVTCPVLLCLLIFAEPVLGLFGPAYESAKPVLQILLLGQLVKVVVGSVGNLLIMTGNEKAQRLNLIWSVVLLLIVGMVLVPSLGAVGGAIAISVAMSVNNVLGLIQVVRKTGIRLI